MRQPILALIVAGTVAAALAFCAAPLQAAAFSRLQVLLPGESPAPGTSSGRTGTPRAQTAGVPFEVTVRACDDQWNLVPSVTDAVQLLASDASATLPAPSQLQAGARIFTLTFNAGGTFTVYGHDQTDNTIPDGASAGVRSLVLQGFAFSRITQKNQYAGTPMTVTVTAQDPNGNVVTGYSGDVSLTGSPATQAAGHAFLVGIYATDSWWNQIASGDQVRVTSSDPAASTPVSGTLGGGYTGLSVSLGTVGTQTLTVSDQTNSSIASSTSAGIAVIPSAVDHFVIASIASPQSAGTPVNVTVRATDVSGNTILGYNGTALVAANTGPGSTSPEQITFTAGLWTGPMTFRGAGGAVSFTVSDFSAPPHTGTSNAFAVAPGAFAGYQVLVPGETAQGGTESGRTGTPADQTAGANFTLTLRAVDAWFNLVPGRSDTVAIGSSDPFAATPAETTLANGQRLVPAKLFKTGLQRFWVSGAGEAPARADTSSAVRVTGGPFARLLVLAPGESPAPGSPTGRTGAATDQSINYAFTVTVLATDAWWNPVGGVSDLVRLTCSDPMAALPRDTTLADGQAQLSVRLATGGFQQIGVSDVSQPSKAGSATQVRAISSGFHLEAAVSPAQVGAGSPFTLTVRVTNDAGSVIQEINSFVTVEVRSSTGSAAGRGTLLTTSFQLLQGQRSVSETYTFAEPIVIVARDDTGNAPAISNVIEVVPGQPDAIRLSSQPGWVGGNKHATLLARLVDAYENGIPKRPVVFQLLSGTGTLAPIDSLTDSTGVARGDFLSPRQPETDQVRASAGSLVADLALQTSFMDPAAAGGTITNYPNPFHPPAEGTTLAYVLDDDATVTLRVFTLSGDLVRREVFERGAEGGRAGSNQWVWDGRNGSGSVVASGGYIALLEAQGVGETLHVVRRKIAVIR